MPERLTPAERTEPLPAVGDERAHPLRIGARVVAQGPADRLAHEELPAVRRLRRRGVGRAVEVGVDRIDEQVPVEIIASSGMPLVASFDLGENGARTVALRGQTRIVMTGSIRPDALAR